MKYSLTYFLAFILSAVMALSFKNVQLVVEFFQNVSYKLLQGGVMISCIFVLLTTVGAVASLRRKGTFFKTFLKTIIWGILSMVVSVLLSYIMSVIFPAFMNVDFASSPSDIIDSGMTSAYDLFSDGGLFSSPYKLLLLIVALSYLIGYFTKPDLDVIRPAYIVLNSFTEIGFRFARFMARVYNFALFFIGTFWFMSIGFQSVGKEVRNLMIILFIGALVLLFIVYPLMYLTRSHFQRKTAFALTFSSLAIALSSFFTRNVLFSIPSEEVVLRHENGIPKKNAASMTPFLTLCARPGVAFVSFVVVFIIAKYNDYPVNISAYFTLPFIVLALSGASALMHPGLEVLFVVTTSLNAIGIESKDYAMILFAILPLVSSISSMIDTGASFFGVAALGVQETELFVNLR